MLHQSPGGSQNIGFQDATFTWSNDTDGSTTPSRHNFVLRIENELLFKRGCINLIVSLILGYVLSQAHHFIAWSDWGWKDFDADGIARYVHTNLISEIRFLIFHR